LHVQDRIHPFPVRRRPWSGDHRHCTQEAGRHRCRCDWAGRALLGAYWMAGKLCAVSICSSSSSSSS